MGIFDFNFYGKKLFLFTFKSGFFIFFINQGAWAMAWEPASFYLGSDGTTQISLPEIVEQIKPGDILVIGETHNISTVAKMQNQVLKALRDKNYLVTVGMEFIDWTQQNELNLFRQGTLLEADFLKAINWGGFDFSNYKDQILFPMIEKQETTLGINAPRFLTSKISKQGFESLTEDELKMIPSQFSKGNEGYFERFQNLIGHKMDPLKLERYFLAQSLWDDTMAQKTLDYVNQNADKVFVIIVGEFHVQYQGGLPDRLLKRGAKKVWTLSQVGIDQLSDEEIAQLVLPNEYGQRADFIWLHEQ